MSKSRIVFRLVDYLAVTVFTAIMAIQFGYLDAHVLVCPFEDGCVVKMQVCNVLDRDTDALKEAIKEYYGCEQTGTVDVPRKAADQNNG